jgi:hypothetical protein
LRLAWEEPALADLAAAAEWSIPQAQAVVEEVSDDDNYAVPAPSS